MTTNYTSTAIKREFQPWDLGVFAATILASLGIGVYHAVAGGGGSSGSSGRSSGSSRRHRRTQTTSEYLVGGRQMSFLPVSVSLLVSFSSSIMMLGIPAESYVYGLQQVWRCFFSRVF